MSLRADINRLKKQLSVDDDPNRCLVCGRTAEPDRLEITLIDTVSDGLGEPLGHYYETNWRSHRPGERKPFPPDPRPTCPGCGRMQGVLILTAVYDPQEWAELNGTPAPIAG